MQTREKIFQEIKDDIEIVPSLERTYLIVAAVAKDRSRNIIQKIYCKKGVPIGGYVYNSFLDCYNVECASFVHLGYLPYSFDQKIKGLDWKTKIPVNEKVILKQLDASQKKELKKIKDSHPEEFYKMEYIQMIDPN
ncbi:MAG: hypothetical protein EKK64_00375 [Neisseriaceae bacterium]|nr:MAG: hypothetical protein EKK64_00375 [Neisseriaceae bacterium]